VPATLRSCYCNTAWTCSLGDLNKATCLLAIGKKELAKGSFLACFLGVLKGNGALEGYGVLKG
jgi:hypothetical protein